MKTNPKPQIEKFRQAAVELEADQSEDAFDAILKKVATSKTQPKICPECGHIFKGNGWDGIDAHWRSKHEDVMPYEEAWPLLRDGKYPE